MAWARPTVRSNTELQGGRDCERCEFWTNGTTGCSLPEKYLHRTGVSRLVPSIEMLIYVIFAFSHAECLLEWRRSLTCFTTPGYSCSSLSWQPCLASAVLPEQLL